MTTPVKSGLFTNEPQVVQGLLYWILVQVGAILIGHTHLLTNQQWSGLTTALVPIFSAVVIGAITLVWRKWLAPAWKVVNVDFFDKTGPFGAAVRSVVVDEFEKLAAELEQRFPAPTTDTATDTATPPVVTPASPSPEVAG